MTSYEVLTGCIPFGELQQLGTMGHDVVIIMKGLRCLLILTFIYKNNKNVLAFRAIEEADV